MINYKTDEAHVLATAAMELSKEISRHLQPMLKGYPPELHGAVLADLCSIWLAGHAPALRETILKMHVREIRKLIPINEKIIFGAKGHPAGRK